MKHNISGLLVVLLILSALCLCLTGCAILKGGEDEITEDVPSVTINSERKEDIARNYRAILEGSAPFYSVDAAADITIEQLNTSLTGNTESDVKVSAFSVIDLDGDGEEEVLIWLIVDTNHSFGYTVLHHIGDSVYGYTVPYQSLVDLKRDGTFSFYFNDNRRGSGSMSFTKTGYTLEQISYRDGVNTYFVDGVSVSGEEFALAVTRQSGKSRAAWYHFTDANIQDQFPQ